ncbi:MAG: glycosyltransferase [Proteobacteria bacterium]|nr:glycosyltransferase [Pseudomonadota bacterium]
MRRSEPDVVHLHSAVAGWVGRLAARGLGCRVLYSPHAFPFLRDVTAPPRRVYEGAERVAARWTDLLVALSQAEARLAVELGLLPEERVSVLENAVDLPALESEVGPMPPIRSPEGQRVFGLVGALRAQKAPLLLLDAARRARAGGVRARYVLPSTGPDLARVKRAVREYGLHGIVDFAPAENGLAELYRRIDVGVLPSLWEGLPYTLLETTGLGRPLIASDLPVFQDFLRPLDARLLFQRGDAEALARCIALWAGLPSEVLEDVGRRGRSQVARDHALPEWANALQALYRPGDRP